MKCYLVLAKSAKLMDTNKNKKYVPVYTCLLKIKFNFTALNTSMNEK
jgi:hypothetical protein